MTEADCYSSIDELPVFCWRKVQENGDLTYLVKSSLHGNTPKIEKEENNILQIVFTKLNDEYLKQFGFSESFLEIQRKRVKAAILRLQYIINTIEGGDVSMETDIEILEHQLSLMAEQNKNRSFSELISAVEIEMKFQIDELKTSVAKFYYYLRIIEEKNKHGRTTH